MATRLGLYGGPRPALAPAAAIVTAAVTGTAATDLSESEVVSGGETIIVTLTNDTWVTAGATFDAQRQAIIDGLDSAQSESTGWNAEVRDKEIVSAVVRTSDTVVTITLSAAPSYAVTADETITATVPAAALTTSTDAVVASPTFSVTAEAEESVGGGGPDKTDESRFTFRNVTPIRDDEQILATIKAFLTRRR